MPEQGFTAPDGTFYRWDKPTPPTQADVDALVRYHNSTHSVAPRPVTNLSRFSTNPSPESTSLLLDLSREGQGQTSLRGRVKDLPARQPIPATVAAPDPFGGLLGRPLNNPQNRTAPPPRKASTVSLDDAIAENRRADRPTTFQGKRFSDDPFRALPFDQSSFQASVNDPNQAVTLRNGRTMRYADAAAMVSRRTGMRDFRPDRSQSSIEDAYTKNLGPQSGKDVGFNRGQKDSQVPRGLQRKQREIAANIDPKTGERITLSSRTRKTVNDATEAISQGLQKSGTPKVVADLLAGIPTFVPNQFAELQTFGDRTESTKNVTGAAQNLVAGLAVDAAAPLAHAVLAPIGKRIVGKVAGTAFGRFITESRTPAEAVKAITDTWKIPEAQARRVVEAVEASGEKIRWKPDPNAGGPKRKTISDKPESVKQSPSSYPANTTKAVEDWRKALDEAYAKRVRAQTTYTGEHADSNHVKFSQQLANHPDRLDPTKFVAGKSGEEVTQEVWVNIQPEAYQSGRAEGHERMVEKAIQRGDAIPYRVLADYPEIEAKYRPRRLSEETPKPKFESKSGTGVAQSVEQQTDNLLAAGSNPAPGTKPAETTRLTVAKRTEEAERGLTKRPEPVPQGSNAQNHAAGKKWVQEGGDADALIRDLASENRAAKPEEYGAIVERRRQLLNDVNAKAKAVDDALGTGGHAQALKDYEDAKTTVAAFDGHLDRVKGASGGSLQSLKIGTTVEEGDFAQVVREAERQKGGKLDPKAEQRFKDQIADLNRQIEEHKGNTAKAQAELDAISKSMAEGEVSRARSRGGKRTRENIRADRADAVKAFNKASVEAASRASSGLPVSSDQLRALGRIAKTYVEEGALTLEETVAKVHDFLKANGVHGIEDRHIHDAIAGNYDAKPKPLTETQVRGQGIKRDAVLASATDRVERGDFGFDHAQAVKRKANVDKRQAALTKESERREYLIEQRRKAIRQAIEASKPRNSYQKASTVVRDVANIPRALKTSFDLSAPLRQGLVLSTANPKQAAHAFAEQLRACKDPVYAAKANKAILEGEMAPTYKKAGLYLSDPESGAIGEHEEAFLSRFVGKIPGVGASERAYATYLNTLRASAFEQMTGGGKLSEADLKAIANFINVATGRGSLGKFEQAGNGLASVLFSPRYLTSRFQLLAGAPLYSGGSLKARALIAKQMGSFAGAVFAAMKLAEAAGAKVSYDRNSSDFGKIRLGDTRIDMMAGLQQAFVFASRMQSGRTKGGNGTETDLTEGGFGKRDRASVGIKFIESKLAPTPGYIDQQYLHNGVNAIGEKQDAADVAKDFFTPLLVNDFYESAQAQGVPKAIALSFGSALGLGVSNQSPKGKKPPHVYDYLYKQVTGK